MKAKVFIDGSSGTTGLRIHERLSAREDIELITIPYEERHDVEVRTKAMAESDITFLCLPDGEAREVAVRAEGMDTVLIDTSTAHRVDPGWAYGFAELPGQRAKIASSKRIANPGCHASGFLALVAPLVSAGVIDPQTAVSCTSLTGYSGGGKKMIAQYETQGDTDRDPLLDSGRLYALTQQHKHLPEMMKLSGIEVAPAFSPIVVPHYSGMETIIPIFGKDIQGTMEDIRRVYRECYQGPMVRYQESADEEGFLASGKLSGRDDMEIGVYGNEERILLIARYDNLGKGASGAAIQNMNIVMGVPETRGLEIGE